MADQGQYSLSPLWDALREFAISLCLTLWLTMMCIIFANKLEQQTDTRQRDGINFCVCLWPGNVDIFHLACRAIWLKLHLLIYDNDSVQLQSSVEAVAECECKFELPKHASPHIMTCPMPDARPMLVIIAHLGAGPWLWEAFTLTLALTHAGIYVNGKRKLLNKQDMLWAALGHTQDPSRTRTILTSPDQADQARQPKWKQNICYAKPLMLSLGVLWVQDAAKRLANDSIILP